MDYYEVNEYMEKLKKPMEEKTAEEAKKDIELFKNLYEDSYNKMFRFIVTENCEELAKELEKMKPLVKMFSEYLKTYPNQEILMFDRIAHSSDLFEDLLKVKKIQNV